MSRDDRYPGITLSRPELASLALGPAKLSGDDAVYLTAIAWAESRGVTNALRPASQNSLGGNDRGVLQINDKAHPDVSDRRAYSPIDAFHWAGNLIRSNGGGLEGMGAWAVGPNSFRKDDDGNPIQRNDLDLAAARESVNAPINPTERIVKAGIGPESAGLSDLPGLAVSSVGRGIEEIGNAADRFVGWAQALGELLGNLLDPEWWSRIGIAALGLLLAVGAVVVASRN